MLASFAFAAPSSGRSVPRVWAPSERKRIDARPLVSCSGAARSAIVCWPSARDCCARFTAASRASPMAVPPKPWNSPIWRIDCLTSPWSGVAGGAAGAPAGRATEALELPDLVDRLPYEPVVGGRRCCDLRLAGKDHEPDPEPLRRAVHGGPR